MNLKSYFSNLSCWEEFEIRCSLLGKKKNDLEILDCLEKIESWRLLIVNKRMVFLDEEGNKVEGKDMELKGDFDVSHSEIESLEGCPRKVGGNFFCFGCLNLKSLEGCPEEVGENFSGWNCPNLKTLEGCPKNVGGSFYCNRCQNLESLEGSPKKIKAHFDCSYCSNLKSLKGCPEEVEGDFYCYDCPNLESLKECPKKVGKLFDCFDCPKIPENEIPDCEIGEKLFR